MYKTLLVFDNYKLLNKIKSLPVWGSNSDFEITTVASDGAVAQHHLKKYHYDLMIVQTNISGLSSVRLLSDAKQKGLCPHVVLCSDFLDYYYVRQSIILGAFDYFIEPVNENMYLSVFNRIKNEKYKNQSVQIYHTEELIDFFIKRDSTIEDYINSMIKDVYTMTDDELQADEILKQIYRTVITEIFNQNDWLDLYLDQQSICKNVEIDEVGNDCYLLQKIFQQNILELFHDFCELYPLVSNDKVQKAILFILNNPESDLKQKTLAANLYINSSFLSTMFTSQTQLYFADYLMKVKLKRASWLLKKTSLPINEIAMRLGYKDAGYFSKLFKKLYRITPSEYRIPDGYDYQI